jgi:hypothetical protein
MKKSNFALRLSPSLMEEARKLANAEGVAVNQLINVAVAEKISALRTEEYFAERSARGDRERALGILKRAGKGRPPVPGDELAKGMNRHAPPTNTKRSSSIDDQLRFAIANKRLIQLRYGGSVRVAEPHDYGIQKGLTRLLIFQRRGSDATQRKSVTGWKLLDVSKIETCLVLEETFSGSRSEPHQRHYVWNVVFARVA